MPQHKSAEKRVRQNERRREQNRLHRSRMRTMMKKLSSTTDKGEATTLLRDTKSMLDGMVSKGLLKKNTAANYKSSLEKAVNALN